MATLKENEFAEELTLLINPLTKSRLDEAFGDDLSTAKQIEMAIFFGLEKSEKEVVMI